MRKFLFWARTPALVASLALGALAACRKESVDPDDFCNDYPTDCATPATVRDLTGLDGCGKVLELANGQRLEPSGPVWDSFASANGQRVAVSYAQTAAVSTCMVGKTVEITCIHAVN